MLLCNKFWWLPWTAVVVGNIMKVSHQYVPHACCSTSILLTMKHNIISVLWMKLKLGWILHLTLSCIGCFKPSRHERVQWQRPDNWRPQGHLQHVLWHFARSKSSGRLDLARLQRRINQKPIYPYVRSWPQVIWMPEMTLSDIFQCEFDMSGGKGGVAQSAGVLGSEEQITWQFYWFALTFLSYLRVIYFNSGVFCSTIEWFVSFYDAFKQ